MRSLNLIAPEATDPAALHLLPSSSMDLLTQLIQKWKDWKMSEVDDIIQTQTRHNQSQEWAKQRRTFLEEKNGLSLLTGKRKPIAPQMELREEVPIGMIRVSEMGVAELGGAEGLKDGSHGVSHQTATSRTWSEAHILRLTTPKSNLDRASTIIRLATGLWTQTSLANQDRRTRGRPGGEDEEWHRLDYDGGAGGHGSEGLRMEGERWWIARSHSGRERLLEWAALLQQVAETRREDLGTFSWDITGRQVPAMNSTTIVQMTTTLDLHEVAEILQVNTDTAGLLERRIVWGEGPW